MLAGGHAPVGLRVACDPAADRQRQARSPRIAGAGCQRPGHAGVCRPARRSGNVPGHAVVRAARRRTGRSSRQLLRPGRALAAGCAIDRPPTRLPWHRPRPEHALRPSTSDRSSGRTRTRACQRAAGHRAGAASRSTTAVLRPAAFVGTGAVRSACQPSLSDARRRGLARRFEPDRPAAGAGPPARPPRRATHPLRRHR